MVELADGQKALVQYARNRRGEPRGCVVVAPAAGDRQDALVWGWSLCRRGDAFERRFGRMIAVGRLERARADCGRWASAPSANGNIPPSLQATLYTVLERAERYFFPVASGGGGA